jgi:hypothetical protein
VYLILDGRNVASLCQVLYGVGVHRFYLNLAGLEEGKDLEDCAFYLRASEEGRDERRAFWK